MNTGRYVGKRDLEETVLKTNLEAVKEVVNQLRFRNIGGLIIIDLIDMEIAANREKVYRALQEALRQDKSRTNILKISELGLVEMTRKRTRENLVQMLCEPCAYCEGRGYVLSSESVAYKVLREIRKDLPRFSGRQIAISVNPRVAAVLLGPARKAQVELAAELGREIEIRARPGIHQEHFEVIALDAGPAVSLAISWLEEEKPEVVAADEPAAAADLASTTSAEGDAADAGPEIANPLGDDEFGDGAPAEDPILDPEPEPIRDLAAAETEAGREVLDVEAESPILPAPDEREEL
jgi:hypothetical protein